MTEGYGYVRRPDMPDPFVTGGVDEPRNMWPRKVKSGLGGAGGYQRQFLTLLNPSNADIIGSGLTGADSTTNGTLTTTANGWDATFGRHGTIKSLLGTSGAAIGCNRTYYRWEMSPIPMVASTYTACPFAWRISSIVCARSSAAATGAAGVAFGLTNYATVPATGVLIPTTAAIQFVSTWAAGATYGTWSSWVADTGGGFSRASGLSAYNCNDPHLMEIEFDGIEKLINFYIDGEVVDQYAPASGDLFTHLTYGSNIEFLVNASVADTTIGMFCCDTIPLVSVLLTDLDD